MPKGETLADEAVALMHGLDDKVAKLRDAVVSNELVIAAQTAVIRELLAARRSDREILDKILEAATQKSDGKVGDALQHIESILVSMAGDMRVVRERLAPEGGASPPA